mgnify:CR=1 FL=1
MPIDDDARAQIERARALIELGRPEQAVELLTTVPQTDPDVVVSVNCALAFAHLRLDQCAEAHASAERAVQAAPDSSEALYWLTATEPDAALALEHSSRLVELEPQWGPCRALRARVLKGNGQTEEAVREAREAARLAPENVFVLNTLGFVLRGSYPDEALEAYSRVLEIDPGDTGAREGIARLKRFREADESSRLYRGLLETNPDQGQYEEQLYSMVFLRAFVFAAIVTLLDAAGWLAMAVPYTLGWRTAALVCGTVWSLLLALALRSEFKQNTAKIAEGMETGSREVLAVAFRIRPFSSFTALASIVVVGATPVVWGAWGLFAPAPSWWSAVGIPAAIIVSAWIAAPLVWFVGTVARLLRQQRG